MTDYGMVHDCGDDCDCDGEGVSSGQLVGRVIRSLPEKPGALIGALTVSDFLRATLSLLMEHNCTAVEIVDCLGEMVGLFGMQLCDLTPEDEHDAMRERLRVALSQTS